MHPVSDEAGFRIIVTRHSMRHPLMQVEDVYKLVYQACFGSKHAVPDRTHAQRRLDEELAQLGDGPSESLLDPIAPDGAIVRVHLRPFLAYHGDHLLLLDAFVRTANEYRGSEERFEACWRGVVGMAAEFLPFSSDEVHAYGIQMKGMQYPAVHHSPAYTAAYRPAYRVVAKEFLPQVFQKLD